MDKILEAFGLPSTLEIVRINTGHINQTYKLVGEQSWVLQRINKNVFKNPEVIASNLRLAADHLAAFHPEYLFLSGIRTTSGKEMVYDAEGFPWRLFPYIHDTITIDRVETEEEAFAAARGFAMLSKNLNGCDLSGFRETIPQFHNLHWRFEQFEEAIAHASTERRREAAKAIEDCKYFSFLVKQYDALISSGTLALRIHHNDTKINNILFDRLSRKVVCVIDLDTLMPGYFMYDLGDMVRTFVSPVDEEESDLTKVVVRKEIYKALLSGYLEAMDEVLSQREKEAISFSGQMMTYIMALRMLTDFLNGDVYYHTTYPGQNLVRASNQLALLKHLGNL